MKRILSISSSRADIGILTPVWQALAGESDVDLHVLLTGMHQAKDNELPVLPDGVSLHSGGSDMGGGDDPAQAAKALANIVTDTGVLLARIKPDLLIVIGDRLDMIPAVIASLPFNVPVVHLSGGDLTLGAIDDRVRHALTKLSHVHCVINVEAAYRVHHMGEEAWRIHVTGGTGLDSLISAPSMTEQEFSDEVGFENIEGLRLVTVHPETNTGRYDVPLCAVLRALDEAPQPTLLTAPNTDPGGAQMRIEIDKFAAERPWAVFRETLGVRLYANAMRFACVMVGNSSSGIIEAATFGLNVINVGKRQEGRACGVNVHHCPNEAEEVSTLLAKLTTQATGNSANSLYGDGQAAPRVVRVIRELPSRDQLLHKLFASSDANFSAPWVAGMDNDGDGTIGSQQTGMPQ